MRRGVDGAVPAVAGNSSGATSGKSKGSCSGSEINRFRKETLNLRGVAELSILSKAATAGHREQSATVFRCAGVLVEGGRATRFGLKFRSGLSRFSGRGWSPVRTGIFLELELWALATGSQ